MALKISRDNEAAGTNSHKEGKGWEEAYRLEFRIELYFNLKYIKQKWLTQSELTFGYFMSLPCHIIMKLCQLKSTFFVADPRPLLLRSLQEFVAAKCPCSLLEFHFVTFHVEFNFCNLKNCRSELLIEKILHMTGILDKSNFQIL